MIMKILGASAALLGLAIIVFAGMAYFELRGAATSENAPNADAMRLTKIVNPGFFAPENSGMKPAELARNTFHRIYLIALGGIGAAVLGVLVIAAPHSPRNNASSP